MSMSALSFTAAHQALARGCELLHKPRELATELVRFLIVKRWHDMEPYGMSLGAGADVEGLWHWMLLNTQIAKIVHEVVGGEVSHNTPDESDESAGEAAQMLRRLKAMTLMQLEGWTPQVEFWEEPGTLMDGLQLIRRVTASGTAPPMAMWTSMHITPPQLHLLAQDLRRRSAQSSQPGSPAVGSPSLHSPRHNAFHSSASSSSPLASPRLRQQQQLERHNSGSIRAGGAFAAAAAAAAEVQVQGGSSPFSVKVMAPNGELRVSVSGSMLVEWLKAVIATGSDVPPEQQKLICSGRQLEDGLSLEQCGVVPGAVVHVVVRLKGF